MENQLTILAESLEKKIQVLGRIQAYNKRQEQAFLEETADFDAFDAALEEKGVLIEELNKLDNGFELLYERLAKQLEANREKYAEEIRSIQQQIAVITEMGMTIQAQEQRNKKLIEDYFSKQRAGIREGRKTSKTAYDYYKKVNHVGYAPPQFMDSKQ